MDERNSINLKSNKTVLSHDLRRHTMIKEPDKTPYITALIIAYNPDQRIVVSLEKLRYLVDFVVIIDNMSSDRSFLEELKIKYDEKFLKILDLNKNYGVASGLNKGIIRLIIF